MLRWNINSPTRISFRTALYIAAMLLISCIAVFAQQQAPAQSRFRISGVAVNSVTGQPLAQVRIFLSYTEDRQDREVMITAADGRFQFDNLPAGKYALGAAKPGFVMQNFEEHEYFSSAIAVGPGLSGDNLVFRVKPSAVITGQVVDDQNEPVRDAQVILFRSNIENGQQKIRHANQTNSDDRGQYRFGSLAPGTYYVVVSARPWFAPFAGGPGNTFVVGQAPQNVAAPLDVTYPVLYFSGATDPNQATPLKLGPGDHLTADFNLTAVPALHIRVHTPKLNPNQGYSVMVMPEAFQGASLQMPVSVQTTMHTPGEVEIGGLAPGLYRLQMVFPGTDAATLTQEVDVQSDMEIDASTGNQVRTISGVLRMQGGLPLPRNAFVLLRDLNSSQGAQARIAPDGHFQFDPRQIILPGKYEVIIGAQNIFVASVTATGARVTGRTVDLRGSEPIQLTISASAGIARLDGTAVSADDKPIAGAMVILVPDDLANNMVLVRRDQSDSDGTFTLPAIVPGHYTLLAIHNGWDLEWMNPAVLKPYLPAGEPVDVQRNGKYNLKVRVQ